MEAGALQEEKYPRVGEAVTFYQRAGSKGVSEINKKGTPGKNIW